MAKTKKVRCVKYIFVLLTLVLTLFIAVLIIGVNKGKAVPVSSSSSSESSSQSSSATISDDSTTSSTFSSDNSSSDSQLSVVPTTTAQKKTYVEDNKSEYTDGLIEFMNKYDEVVDYVYDYPKNMNNVTPKTLSENFSKGTYPLLLQWDSRWGYQKYSTSLVGVSGCGPTAVAMVYAGLTGKNDQTPGSVAEMCVKKGYYTPGSGTSWSLMTEGVKNLGLSSKQVSLSKSNMTTELNNKRPLICSMKPGDFTKSGHFIVITGYKNGEFTVNDPNSRINSEKAWDYETLSSQIKNIWSFRKAS